MYMCIHIRLYIHTRIHTHERPTSVTLKNRGETTQDSTTHTYTNTHTHTRACAHTHKRDLTLWRSKGGARLSRTARHTNIYTDTDTDTDPDPDPDPDPDTGTDIDTDKEIHVRARAHTSRTYLCDFDEQERDHPKRHDSHTCVCAMTPSYVGHDSFICET